MRKVCVGIIVALAAGICGSVSAAEKRPAYAIIEKAMHALGGKAELAKIKAVTWKSESEFTVNNQVTKRSARVVMEGLNRFRQDYETPLESGGAMAGVMILAGDRAVQRFGESDLKLDSGFVGRQKRVVYLTIVPITLVPLTGKEFHVKLAPEAKVNGKLSNGIVATGPDGEPFRLYFDKATGLPVRMVVNLITDAGLPAKQEITYGEYQKMGGILKATRLTVTRDGKPFAEHKISDFAVLEKVDPATFTDTTLRSASLR